ncbi:hypothetical protein ACQ4PT_057395 [Festuca glaucescens]
MTVGGDSGDGEGDPACSLPESIGTARSPAPTSKSKFWADSESSDEGSDDGVAGDALSGSQVSFRYICRSPTPVSGRDLQGNVGESQRAARRARRQRLQKEVALAFASPVTDQTEVKFPSKNEVQRMKHFKTYPVPNRATDMEFDEWSVMEEPTFMLPEVWLRVTGIPADVRNDFLALWALGSIFGKTMEVDMSFTRKNKVLRLRIGCMDATLIPETTDVYISRGFFRLAFEVENKNANAEIDMVEAAHNDGNNNDGNGVNEGNRGNENNKDEVTNMEVEQTMNPGANQGPVGDQRSNANFKQNNMMVTFGTLPPSPIKDDVMLPCVFSAEAGSAQLTELGEKLNGASGSSHTGEVKDVSKLLNGVPVEGFDAMGIAATIVQKEVPKGAHAPTEDEVIAFSGIAPTEVRSSVRLQQKENADDEVMGRAMKLAQQRHDPLIPGVSLGKDYQEALETVDNIKKVEEIRNIQYLQKKLNMSLKGIMVPQI